MPYYFYILRRADNSLYSGVSTNLEKRIKEHNSPGARGAKYIKGRQPVKLIYSEIYEDQGAALRRELEVKKWPKSKKEILIKNSKFLNSK